MPDPSAIPEFDNHARVETIRSQQGDIIGFVAFHRQNSGVPSFGATRLWRYTNAHEALRDALRLSRTMSYKAALAGLPCGGAKAALIDTSTCEEERAQILHDYATAIAPLKDLFVTGTDVGLRQDDLSSMKALGAPVYGFNAVSTPCSIQGVCMGIEETLRSRFGHTKPTAYSYAIQGLGKIGMGVLSSLAHTTSHIVVADIDENRVRVAKETFPSITVVDPDAIHRQDVDAFIPCALGGVITPENVAEMRCAVVAGGANDQLNSPEAGDALHDRGILYAPDYVINAGGLISIFDEYEHDTYDEARVTSKVTQIPSRLARIYSESRDTNRPAHRIAQEHAEQVFGSYTPAHI